MNTTRYRIGDIVNFIGGSQPPKSMFSSYLKPGYVRLLQIRDYKTDEYRTYIPEDSTNKFCCKTDVMIGRYGPPIFQILRGFKGAYNVALIKAEPKEAIENDYLYYFLKQESLFEYMDYLSPRTGGQTGVDLTSLRDYPINLPSVGEQKNIAKVLSTLDEKIELNNRINTELEAVAKLMYDYWFVQFDFPMTAEQAKAIGKPELEGRPYKSSGGKMVYDPVLKREIPEGWEVKTLEHLGNVVGGSTPSKEKDEYFTDSGIPWATPKDLSDNTGKKFFQRGALDVTEAGQKAASLKLMPKGTVLLSSRAPIGYTAIASNPVTSNQGFKSFVSDRGYGSEYIYRTLNHYMKVITQNASGSTFKEISGGTLKTIRIAFPELSLAKTFEDQVGPINQQIEILEKQNQELASLRDWLLPMLMNGQVKVGE